MTKEEIVDCIKQRADIKISNHPAPTESWFTNAEIIEQKKVGYVLGYLNANEEFLNQLLSILEIMKLDGSSDEMKNGLNTAIELLQLKTIYGK